MSASDHARHAAARAFVRSLNILLRFARMYDFSHPRTAKQSETAWSELQTALGSENEAGLLLAVSGEKLLLDGTPIESAAAEKGFARMLSSAGIASIHFSPRVTQESLACLIKGFRSGSSGKPPQLAERIKASLQGDANIHVNEVCFVPADSAVAKSTIAAQLAARTLGMTPKQQDELFSSPEKLLQLIVAAEGNKGAPGNRMGKGEGGSGQSGAALNNAGGDAHAALDAGEAIPETPGRWTNATASMRGARQTGAGSLAIETGIMTLDEGELQKILQVLAQIAGTSEGKGKLDSSSFQSRLSTLPRRARFTVSQALAALAAQAPAQSSDKPTLLKLAEHIAVRFALESYERGHTKVDAVRQMLEEMSAELGELRSILGVYEDRMRSAGIEVQSHLDVLAQQFWAHVPEKKRKAVLESDEAWCIPPLNAREYIEKLVSSGEIDAARDILRNYANGITKESPEVRRQTAMGIAELASLYANCEERFFADIIRQVGVQLSEERDSELQSLVGAAFVRLAQEAAKKHAYRAVQRSVEVVDYVESERPGVGKNLRPRIAVEDRLPEFIEEALRIGQVPDGLRDLLRRLPGPATARITRRFSRAGFREDCELLVSMMESLGADGLEYLRTELRWGSPHESADTIGMLARVDLPTLERELPERMAEWTRTTHDRVVRQIAASGSVSRGHLLLSVFDCLDSLIRPLAIDEMGMSGEQAAGALLLRIAEGDLPGGPADLQRLKAIEALGRLRMVNAVTALRRIAETRKTWWWANPSELRVVAAQAMEKIDPSWVRYFLPKSGLTDAELSIEILDSDPNSSAIRQRRYPRMRLDHPVPATVVNAQGSCRIEIPEMTLSGGVAMCGQSLHPGTIVDLRLNPSQRSVKAQAIVRDANTQARAFEVVDIDLEERAKLRRLLVQIGTAQKQATPQERSRGPRTILANPV